MQSEVGFSCLSQDPRDPITRVLGVRVPCPRVANHKAQGPKSQGPRVSDLRSQGPGCRVSGPDFRLCLFKARLTYSFVQLLAKESRKKEAKGKTIMINPRLISILTCKKRRNLDKEI